jgi:hypothetical protein
LPGGAYWHKAFPYKSSLTGLSGDELADGYEKATSKQWQQQLGASMALLDAGFATLKASSDPAIAGLNGYVRAGATSARRNGAAFQAPAHLFGSRISSVPAEPSNYSVLAVRSTPPKWSGSV